MWGQGTAYDLEWVEATSGVANSGHVCFWFDGTLEGCDSYGTIDFAKCVPPVTAANCRGVFDLQHYYLIFSGIQPNANLEGSGPITIRDIQVWQKDASHNVTN